MQAALQRERENDKPGASAREGPGGGRDDSSHGREDDSVVGGGEGMEGGGSPGHVRAPCGKFLLHISQIMHVMFVSLLTNRNDSSKPNVQSMYEKTVQAPPPMLVFSVIGTVSFISMVIIN